MAESVSIKNKRNGEIDFFKLIAAIYVVFIHSGTIFKGNTFIGKGGLAVEFFFLTSGYFFAASVMKKSNKCVTTDREESTDVLKFIWKKIKGFGTIYLFCFVLQLVIDMCNGDFILSRKNASLVIFDFLLLRSANLPYKPVLNQTWYISSMLLTMFLVYPLFVRKKKLYVEWIAPLSALFVLGVIYKKTGHLISRNEQIGLFSKTFLVGFSEMSLGIFAYNVAGILAGCKLSSIGRFIVTIICTSSVLGAFIWIISSPTKMEEFVVLFLFFVFVVISASGQSYLTRLFPVRICGYLGKLSTSIYFSHTIVTHQLLKWVNSNEFLKGVFRVRTWKRMLFACGFELGIVFVFAALVLVLCEKWIPFIFGRFRTFLAQRRSKR